MAESIGPMLRLYTLTVLNDSDLGVEALTRLRELEGLPPSRYDGDAPRHVKIDVSGPGDDPAIGGAWGVTELRETVLAELEALLASIAEDTVAAVNHAQVLRVIRAGRDDC